jgi:hypothetical protein
LFAAARSSDSKSFGGGGGEPLYGAFVVKTSNLAPLLFLFAFAVRAMDIGRRLPPTGQAVTDHIHVMFRTS